MFWTGIELPEAVLSTGSNLSLPSLSFATPASSGVFGWQGVVKRTTDIAGALVGLAMAFLPMLLFAMLIRYESRGPVLFRQRRVGLDGTLFTIWKFRTMHVHAVPLNGRLCEARKRDPRITCIGAWLRHTSLDELPQLVNVLRGDMSLVGPRPHAPGTCAEDTPFEEVTPRYAYRHRVRSGLTGLAQVCGWRGETDTHDKLLHRVESDLEYIASWSLWLDLVVLWRTAGVVVRGGNAY
jgi:polysaccharide biosynthesis protein PslA